MINRNPIDALNALIGDGEPLTKHDGRGLSIHIRAATGRIAELEAEVERLGECLNEANAALTEIENIEATWCKEGESIEQRLQRERDETLSLLERFGTAKNDARIAELEAEVARLGECLNKATAALNEIENVARLHSSLHP